MYADDLSQTLILMSRFLNKYLSDLDYFERNKLLANITKVATMKETKNIIFGAEEEKEGEEDINSKIEEIFDNEEKFLKYCTSVARGMLQEDNRHNPESMSRKRKRGINNEMNIDNLTALIRAKCVLQRFLDPITGKILSNKFSLIKYYDDASLFDGYFFITTQELKRASVESDCSTLEGTLALGAIIEVSDMSCVRAESLKNAYKHYLNTEFRFPNEVTPLGILLYLS